MRAAAFFNAWPMLTRTALAFALLGGVALPNRHAGLFSNHPDPLAARAEHAAAWNRALGLRPTAQEIARAVAAEGGRCRAVSAGRWRCSVERPGRIGHPFTRTGWTCTLTDGDARPAGAGVPAWATDVACRRIEKTA